MAQTSPSSHVGSSALQVILYWAIVAVPLGWGVYKTVNKSIPLFTGVSATAPAATPAPSTATPPPLATPAPVESVAPAAAASPAASPDAATTPTL